jgi:hypothetical protein
MAALSPISRSPTMSEDDTTYLGRSPRSISMQRLMKATQASLDSGCHEWLSWGRTVVRISGVKECAQCLSMKQSQEVPGIYSLVGRRWSWHRLISHWQFQYFGFPKCILKCVPETQNPTTHFSSPKCKIKSWLKCDRK